MKFLIVLLFTTLSGCAQNFDCPYKEGVRCLRLSEVDKQISAGKLTQKNNTKPLKMLEPQKVPDSPFRTPEEVLTVWVAPYQTEDGTYHEEKLMHFVARPAEWLNTVNEIKDEDETLTKSH
jgi:hypothetical protein